MKKYIGKYKKIKLLQTNLENQEYQAQTYVIFEYDSSNRTMRKYTEEIDKFVDAILAEEVAKDSILERHKQKLTAVQIHEYMTQARFNIGLSTINKNIRQKL